MADAKQQRTLEGSTIRMDEEADYICDACGEQIVVPIDLSAGPEQTYVEDCPVCCRPNVLHILVDEEGRITIESRAE